MPSTASRRQALDAGPPTPHIRSTTPESTPPAGPPPALSPSHPRPSIVASASPSSLFVRTMPRTRSQRSQSRLSSVTASQSSNTASESSRPPSLQREAASPSPAPQGPRQVKRPRRRDADDPADVSSGSASSSSSSLSSASSSAVALASTLVSGNQASASTSRRLSQDAIVISSSDESDSEQPPRRLRRLGTARTTRQRGARASDAIDPDESSQSGFLIERIVRRPQPPTEPILVGDDSIVEVGQANPSDSSQTESEDDGVSSVSPPGATEKGQPPTTATGLRLPGATPPRARPLAVSHPLLSKYTCPICLCTPFPNVVATPCGHVFCSECLFAALHAPIKQKRNEIRSQLAAFAAFPSSSLSSAAAHAGLAAAEFGQWHLNNASPPAQNRPAGTSSGQTNSSGSGSGSASGSNQPSGSTNASTTPRPKMDPLVGTCPVCRTTIEGGFIGGSMNAKKRSVFGLELKLGKPIDDPRKAGWT